MLWQEIRFAVRNLQRIGQFEQHLLTDARENLRSRRSDESTVLIVGNDVGGGSFADITVLIEQDGFGARRPGVGLLIGEVVVHATATLEFGRPALGGDLANVDDRGFDAASVLLCPTMKWKGVAVDANRRIAGIGSLAGSDKDDEVAVVAILGESRIVPKKAAASLGNLLADRFGIPTNDFQ